MSPGHGSLGGASTAARLYGYLLLSAEPVSLDRITSDLEISKSSASAAARLLEQYTLARRHGERGSKTCLVSGCPDNMRHADRTELPARCARLTSPNRATTSASGNDTRSSQRNGRFYLAIREAMESSASALAREGSAALRAPKPAPGNDSSETITALSIDAAATVEYPSSQSASSGIGAAYRWSPCPPRPRTAFDEPIRSSAPGPSSDPQNRECHFTGTPAFSTLNPQDDWN